MAIQKQVYKSPEKKKSLMSVVVSGCKTPVLSVKFCNLVRPFYYPNSPTIPRYSVATVFNPENHKEFFRAIQTIEQNEGVESIIKPDSKKVGEEYEESGNLLIKFQTRNQIPVFAIKNGQKEEEAEEIELQDELARGEMIQVVYEVLRYTKKNTNPQEYGLSFKPLKIFYFPELSKNKEG